MTYLIRLYPGDETVWLVARVALQVTVVLAIVVIADALPFRKRPAIRHLLALCGLAFALVSPFAGLALDRCEFPYWKLPRTPLVPPAALHERDGLLFIADRSVPPGLSEPRSPDSPLVSAERTDGGIAVVASGPLTSGPSPRQHPPAGAQSGGKVAWVLLFALWGAGSAILIVRRLRGALQLGHMLRRGTPVTDPAILTLLGEVSSAAGLKRVPQLKACVRVATPCAVGIRRPTIVLPAMVPSRISESALRDVFAHEAAHLARRDLWIGLLQTLVTILYWPHPLLHWLNRQLAQAREELCDNHVLEGRPAAEYAQTLLDLSLLCRALRPLPAFGLLSPTWDLRARIAGILDARRSRKTRTSRRGLLAALTLTSLVGLLVALGDPSGGRTFGPLKAEDDTMRAVLRGRVVDDEQHPVPGAIVRFANASWLGERTAETNAEGEFELPAKRAPVYARLLATKDESGSTRRGYFERAVYDGPVVLDERATDVAIVLKPERISRVKVIDGAGNPVPQADVHVHTVWGELSQAATDDRGEAVLRLPADAMVKTVSASKPRAGFDYHENYRVASQVSYAPLPEEIELRLDGFRRVEVRVVDSADNPVAGVKVTPWTVKREGKLWYAQPDAGELAIVTDARGLALFETIPADLTEGLTFLIVDDRLSCPDPPAWLPDEDKGPVTAKVLRNARVRGRVLHADGKPAAGLVVQGEGRGRTHHYFRDYAQTQADGTFEMWVYPKQTCMFTVTNIRLASNTVTGRLFAEEEEVDGIDFRLMEGTLVRGRITDGAADGPPAIRQQVTLTQKGVPHKTGLLWSAETIPVELVRWCTTDEQGEYALRVGHGEFTLLIPGDPYSRNIELRIADQAEIRNDSVVTVLAPRRFSGQVLDRTDTPASQAMVWARPEEDSFREIQMLADRQGRFEADGWQRKIFLYSRSADGRKAAFGEMSAEEASAELLLRPASRITGTVRHRNGTPAANCVVRAIIWHSATQARSGNHIADVLTTADKEGRYVLTGLPVGARVDLLANPDLDLKQSVSGGSYNVRETGVIEAADIRPR